MSLRVLVAGFKFEVSLRAHAGRCKLCVCLVMGCSRAEMIGLGVDDQGMNSNMDVAIVLRNQNGC